jgi:ATP-dependent exoDNAse (exonuclease V) alpha subunit
MLFRGNLHGRSSRNEDNPLDCDLLIADETSMVDDV